MGIANDRDFETVRRLSSDAHVDGAMTDEHAACRVIQDVALRKGLQSPGERQDVGPSVPAEACGTRARGRGAFDGLAAAGLSVAAKSPRKMRPPGPEPAMVDKSIPASRARRRLAGEAFTRPWLCRSAGSPSPGSGRPGSGDPGSGGPRSGAAMDAPAGRIGAARSGAAVTSRGGGVGAARASGRA